MTLGFLLIEEKYDSINFIYTINFWLRYVVYPIFKA